LGLSVSKYAYISAKVKGMRLRLLDSEDYKALIDCHDLNQVLEYLENTDYGEEIAEARLRGSEAAIIEEAIMKNLFKTFRKVAEKAPSTLRSFILESMRKFEVENIKAILRCLRAGLSPREALGFITPIPFGLPREAYEGFLEKITGIEDLVRRMENTDYGTVLKASLDDYLSKGSLLPLEAALDKHLYGSLWARGEKMKGRDRRISTALLGMEIDLLNIKVILRSKSLGLGKEDCLGYLIPILHNLTREQIEKALEAEEVGDAIVALSARPYAELLAKTLVEYETTGFFKGFDIERDRIILKENRRIVRIYPSPFHAGTVLSFLNLKWFEVRNLRTLIYGKEDGLLPEALEGLLIL
jgi:ATP synthase A1 C subunit